MNVTVNDTPLSLPEGATLADALATRTMPPSGVATAVNGTVVPAALRGSHALAEGDRIVIIKAFMEADRDFVLIAITPPDPVADEALGIAALLDAGWWRVHLRHPGADAATVEGIINAIPRACATG